MTPLLIVGGEVEGVAGGDGPAPRGGVAAPGAGAPAAPGGGDGAPTGIERGENGGPTGRLWRLDGWLRHRVPPAETDLSAVGREAAALGVTGFTDADPERTAADVVALSVLPQRLHLMGPLGFATRGPV